MESLERFTELNEPPARLFAVGDVHGCSAELSCMLKHLSGPCALSQNDLVVFIGDYVDRGPDSKGVIDLLLEFQRSFPATIFLKGNHEHMLMGFLGLEPSEGWAYLQNGGAACLKSYNISLSSPPEEVLNALPREHIGFLSSLQRYILTEKFVLVHAGLNPLRDIRSQLDQDIFWIRDEFISNIHHFDRTIVFGHTPFHAVLEHPPYKIGVDTGLVFGNMLSCLDLSSGEIHQIKRGENSIIASRLQGFPAITGS